MPPHRMLRKLYQKMTKEMTKAHLSVSLCRVPLARAECPLVSYPAKGTRVTVYPIDLFTLSLLPYVVARPVHESRHPTRTVPH